MEGFARGNQRRGSGAPHADPSAGIIPALRSLLAAAGPAQAAAAADGAVALRHPSARVGDDGTSPYDALYRRLAQDEVGG